MFRSGLAHTASGSGKPLLLIHPVGLDKSFWNPMCKFLQGAYRVLSVDLPGHGETPLGAGEWTTARYAHEIGRFIAETCGEPATVVGLSLGGMVAQELALAEPALVRHLVLCGCTATFPEEARPTIRERGTIALHNGMNSVIEPTLRRWFSEEFIAAGGADAVRLRLETDSVEAWAAAWSAISRHEAQSRLVALRMPVDCICGQMDGAATPDAVRVMADAIPNATLHRLRSAPHMMHIETSQAFADLLSSIV